LVYVSSVEMLPWVIKVLKKIFKTFLWIGSEVVQGGKCVVAWGSVQRPMKLRGLGIKNLKLLGNAIRLQWLWLHRTDEGRTWGAYR
jgi:hypothetical protein